MSRASTPAAPPGPRQVGPFRKQPRNDTRITHGLITHGSLGERFVPLYSRPWSGLSTLDTTFPNWRGSMVAPNGLAPTYVVAINTYSPIGHRSALTAVVPPMAEPAANHTRQAGGGAPVQRRRPYAMPYVTRWPQVAPVWPSWVERAGSR